ncbi:MAG: proline--tRNA ligase, partial [Campylobacterales bacterium]
MRYSRAFIPTTKESPKEATLASHIFLTRAGFISQVAAGIYNLLPLGKIVLEKISRIVREELDRVGCIEVQLGFVTPAQMWRDSQRYEKYGKELLRFNDRKEQEFVLGPTHEEMMVELVKNRVTSYKQLPLNLYQINLKFRDEARPRFGLMRGREFMMKDGYSFHADYEDMLREFHLMEATYRRIFERLGLKFKIVDADSGAIGGSGSKEFMVLAESGEDTIVLCSQCDYAANLEAAKRRKPERCDLLHTTGEIHTPGLTTIEELSKFLNRPKSDFIKAVAKRAIYDEGSEIVLFFISGSDELEETKAKNSVNANDLVDVSSDELSQMGLVPGFIGPIGLDWVRFVVDEELKGRFGMVGGANKVDYHLDGIAIEAAGDDIVFADLIAVQPGDACPCCGAPLEYSKGIEVGHIFQLGERYSAPLEAKFLDQHGKARPFVMGTYGIGVSRLMAAIIEQCHDERGCQWPLSVAPYHVAIIVSNIKDEAQQAYAADLYSALKESGIEVLWDDRDERFGVKMADFELIGIPYGIIVGKNLAEGSVELLRRSDLSKE